MSQRIEVPESKTPSTNGDDGDGKKAQEEVTCQESIVTAKEAETPLRSVIMRMMEEESQREMRMQENIKEMNDNDRSQKTKRQTK